MFLLGLQDNVYVFFLNLFNLILAIHTLTSVNISSMQVAEVVVSFKDADVDTYVRSAYIIE